LGKPVMISVSGVRGIVGQGLTPELMLKFSAAAGMFYGKGSVLVGRDSRVTGNMIKHAVFSGLMSVGCDPVDIGICSTPTVEHAVKFSDAVGGIIITASHNPAEWNALKLLNRDGIFLNEEEGRRVKDIIDKDLIEYVMWENIGVSSEKTCVTSAHIKSILSMDIIDVAKIKERKFKVALDCVNGAGSTVMPEILGELGCEIFPINMEPTGDFSHNPEPVPGNLTELCQVVRDNKADIGVAVDPDVDRCAIIDENGNPVGEEYTLVLSEKYVLEKRKGPVVANVSTTRAVDDVAREAGVEVFRTKVGEINVVKKMIAVNASVGGEGNGGLILPDVHLGRDAPMAAAVILSALAESDKTVSELKKEVPLYYMAKNRIEIANANADEILKKIIDMSDESKLDLTDGVKINEENYWIQVRKSNTEPIIRIMAEAATQEKAQSLCDRYIEIIKKFTG